METDTGTTLSAWLEPTGAAKGTPTPIRGTCSLGRSANNQVVLPDDKVSRRHAMINVQGQGEFWLVDLGSSNGTYLNSRRVGQPCRLTDGDRIEISSFSFVFRQKKASANPDTDRTTEKTIQDIRSMNCWLMVADLEDSTQYLKSLPAEQVPRATGRWLSTCKHIVEDHQGTINKFLGDGFFAYWLDREQTADVVARALRAFLRLLVSRDAPRFRAVLHYGKVFVGGEGSLGEESLMGAEVNFVFRMEKLAAHLAVPCLLSESVQDRLKQLVPVQEHGRHPVQSFEGEFPFYTIQEQTGAGS
ncbi:MAG TPA: adenylate/guanylate cyclase domain-containing protein [Verrucomicrobiae bacterium]|nr:adenylate/guanylate cyclase domain-containing protein [Verrucomicrobiae bacterium]